MIKAAGLTKRFGTKTAVDGFTTLTGSPREASQQLGRRSKHEPVWRAQWRGRGPGARRGPAGRARSGPAREVSLGWRP